MKTNILKSILFMLLVVFLFGCATVTTKTRQSYINQHPNISQKTKDAILKGQVYIGMSKDEVIASWGKPYRVNRTVFSNYAREQWVYGTSDYIGHTYLYFEDGVLTAFQD